MPLPRFEKLPTARQQAIYDAALEELSAHGPAASVNRILAACAVSKGALYYYFADRDDLLRSAITDRIDAFLAAMRAEVRPPQTVAAFWEEVARMVALGSAWFAARPRVLAAFARIAGLRTLSFRPRDTEQKVLATLEGALATGQRLGAVRSDLPREYLLPLTLAVARASDQWLLSKAQASADERAAAVAQVAETYRRLLAR